MINHCILSSLSGVSSSLSPSLPFVCPVEGRLFSCGEEENRRWKMSYWLQSRVHEYVTDGKKDRMIIREWVQWHINNNLMSDAPYCTNPCSYFEGIFLIVPFSTNGNIKSSLCLQYVANGLTKKSSKKCARAKFTGLLVHTSVRGKVIRGDEKKYLILKTTTLSYFQMIWN